MKIVIVDYGMGNIRSIIGSLKYLGIEDVLLSSSYDDLKSSDKLILPGVGSFGKAMNKILDRKLNLMLEEIVLEDKKPILGICLGMQLMSQWSNEDGLNEGLGYMETTVRKFEETNLLIPHVGFNQVVPCANSRLFEGISRTPDFYFTHSYRMMSEGTDDSFSMCNYGGEFIASFEKENIAGVQFHPELSQKNGLKLLKNFIDKFKC